MDQNMQIDWRWKAMQGGHDITTGNYRLSNWYSAPIDLQEVNGFDEILGEMLSKGFTSQETTVDLAKCESETRKGRSSGPLIQRDVTYRVWGSVRFVRGKVAVSIKVDTAAMDTSTPESAKRTAAWKAGTLTYAGEPVPGGKGQRKAVSARAAELFALANDVRHWCRDVEIEYETRGGRGGWKRKVAHARFSIDELEAKPRPGAVADMEPM